MNSVDQIVQRVAKTKHGFRDIKKAAEEVAAMHTAKDAHAIARALFASDVPQARMIAVFVFGMHAAISKPALRFMRQTVSRDADWRMQEILAQAFDQCCKDTGYEAALPMIEDWLADANPNVRRAVSEGLRIWTARPYLKEHPETAVALLSRLKADDSDYVRRSAGNALRDVSRKHAKLVRRELAKWNEADKRVAQVKQLAGLFLS